MNITLRLPQGDVDLDVAATSDATVGDLVDALALEGFLVGLPTDLASHVAVDGCPAADDHSLEEVGCTDGAVVEVGVADPARRTREFRGATAVRLGVAGGLDAGRWLTVEAGRHRIGRGADALFGHATTSARHATIDVEPSGRVTVSDHGSRNGTWVDGHPVGRTASLPAGSLLRTGAVLARVDGPQDLDRPRADGRAFNRPPRPVAGPDPAPLRPPAAPANSSSDRPTLPLASVVGGLAMGAVMFAMTGTLAYAALAFLTPIVAVFGALSARRRHGRDQRRRAVAERRALADFADAVQEAAHAMATRQRAMHPDLAEVVRRATAPSIRLWERRLEHGDALHLVVGHATRPWSPPLQADGPPAEGVREAIDAHAWLREVPIVAPGGVIGIVGDRPAALAVARGLVAQACVHHGPADLEGVLVTPDVLAWDGAKWLPHLRDPATGRPRAANPHEGRNLLGAILSRRRGVGVEAGASPGESGPALLVVLDGVATCEGRDAPGRALLRGVAGRVLGIVVADSVDQLPASCDTVVAMEGPDGACRVTRPAEAAVLRGVLASGMSEPTLARTARALAGLDDPEAAGDRDLPSVAALPELFATPPTSMANVRRLWREQRADGRLRTPIGVATDGPVVVDLNADGPHALVAGTTGAGKSELLRSIVAGLAAGADPDHVAFVLVDYKGGAAFDRCAELPHVVGLVTDLDDDLAQRALICLHAELQRRERLLRAEGVGDLDGYRQRPVAGTAPLPDLVVVVDEFATLAAELPDFLDSLVGIAQRGRSLGVHLILATQRPSGVVSEDIRANTNLRIALRVQDRQDSTDVIEDVAAAGITRDQPGRAFVRLGPGNLVGIQSALVTGPARGDGRPVRVVPFGLDAPARVGIEAPSGQSDLDLLVRAVRSAFGAEGLATPRQPWPAALPNVLPLPSLRAMQVEAGPSDGAAPSSLVVDEASPSTVRIALEDDPGNQRRCVTGWDPEQGSLLLVGALGSGVTSTLRTVVVEAARTWSPEELHVHVLDAGRGDLAVLEGLPHVSSVVRLGDDERVARLVARLAAEVDRRRRGEVGAAAPRVLLAVDDWESFSAAHDLGPDAALVDELSRVVVEGPSVGVVTVLSAGRPAGVGSRLLSSVGQRWVFRLPDDADGAFLGLPRGVASLPAGRAVVALTGARLQVARVEDPEAHVAEVARLHASTAGLGPSPVGRLSARVEVKGLGEADVDGPVWRLPVGQRGDDLGSAELRLHAGEHALVLGPARSGRTTVLCALAAVAARAGVRVVVAAPRSSPLLEQPAVEAVEPTALPEVLAGASAPTLVLVDDADSIDVPGLEAAVGACPSVVRVVAAGRADAIRSNYAHWARGLARSRVGLLLSPDVDLDGDLFGVRIPRTAVAPSAPGRGWLVEAGEVVQCQPATVGRVGIRLVVPA